MLAACVSSGSFADPPFAFPAGRPRRIRITHRSASREPARSPRGRDLSNPSPAPSASISSRHHRESERQSRRLDGEGQRRAVRRAAVHHPVSRREDFLNGPCIAICFLMPVARRRSWRGRDVMLKKRKLGKQGLEVSELGLGCMGMSQSYGTRNDPESIATVQRAVDLGVTRFDTAEAYAVGHNEELLGRALEGKREQVIIATKFGFRFDDGKIVGLDSRPQHIREVVEASLRRLQTDYIDLLYQHRVDKQVPIEDVVGAMADLVRQGKVRYLGLSEAGEETIRRAHKVHPISALQSEYSLWERNLEPRIIPLLRQLGIGLVAFAPLGRGFLSGTVQRAESFPEGDFRRNDPRLQGANFDANVRIASTVQEIAKRKAATPGQVALAWLLSRGEDMVPIPGTKRRKYLEENVAAADVVLTAADLAQLEAALPPTAGPRYSERQMAEIDR